MSEQPTAVQPLGGEPGFGAQFIFEVDGVQIGSFREVSGLEVDVTVHEHVEGGESGYVHKFPAGMRWPNIVFRRGLIQTDALFEWVNRSAGEGFAANENKLVRSTGAITVTNDKGDRLRSWNLREVFAVKWTGPTLAADSTTPLEETLEIAHHGFTAATRSPS